MKEPRRRGLFEKAGLVVCVGVGSLDRSEQDALQQIFRNRRAVHRDERSVAPVAFRMDGLGENLLADARFAPDHHRGSGSRGDPGGVDDRAQFFIAAHDAVEGVKARGADAGERGFRLLPGVAEHGRPEPDDEGDASVLLAPIEKRKEIRDRAGQIVFGGFVPVGPLQEGFALLQALHGGDQVALVREIEAGDVPTDHIDFCEPVGAALDGIHVFADALGVHDGDTDGHGVPQGLHFLGQDACAADIVEFADVEIHSPPLSGLLFFRPAFQILANSGRNRKAASARKSKPARSRECRRCP